MYQLSPQDIQLGVKAGNKKQAIQMVATALIQAGYANAGYDHGMIERERQTSTYLGNGIAIPHGTTDTRDLVLKTGIQVFQFPQGVEWGHDQIAYVVIGIAAQSDEHLDILRRLTHLLNDDDVAHRLAVTDSPEEMRALLLGNEQGDTFLFDISLISLNVPATDLMTLQAINIGRLQQTGAIEAGFVSEVMSGSPLPLGQGIWFSDASVGNKKSAMAIARPLRAFHIEQQPVGMLITIAMADDQPQSVLDNLLALINSHQAKRLLDNDAAGILAMLTHSAEQEDSAALSKEFIIRNENGLHARPGATLVNVVKQFNSTITITNLDGSGKQVNGRSLMKVVALGVKKGHRLKITASGDDAQQALDAIEKSINQGLGEGVV